METWVKFYEDVFGMTEMIHFSDEDISTEYSALMSKVVSRRQRPREVPDQRAGRGQAQVADRRVPRVLRGRRARSTSRSPRATSSAPSPSCARRGVEFLTIPPTPTTTTCPTRVGEIDEQLEDLRELGILVDRDDEGYLLQIFTKPVGDRPTMFFEIIERHGARGFGDGNFKALFEAIEREQERRGNL